MTPCFCPNLLQFDPRIPENRSEVGAALLKVDGENVLNRQ